MVRASQIFVLVVLGLGFIRYTLVTNVEAGAVGVRYNNVTGLQRDDLEPGYHWEVLGLQRIWRMPSHYLFLNYTREATLSIRTKDNNTVRLDVSVPYRIIPGKANAVMEAGNHLTEAGGKFRFERFANDTTISVLREHLAELQSHSFYDTEERLRVAQRSLELLNESLRPLNLEAAQVLIRASYFRGEYEQQLASIQLNEQQKLLDKAKETVALAQQKLDNYTQETNALAAAKEQDWLRRIAELDRAYQVGLVDTGEDSTPGAVRRELKRLNSSQREVLVARAAELFRIEPADVTDAHLLGIKNVEAETTEYSQRVKAAADGVRARLTAEGQAKIATVEGAYEKELNALLASPGGRAYVAYHAADNVQFDETLTFQSSDGVPSVLRLGDFAKAFMGKK